MQTLESKHKSELSTLCRSQERELEQMRSAHDRDLEKLVSRVKGDRDQRVKHEVTEEKRFGKSLRDKQDVEMKHFLAQQKQDYRITKNLFKKVREERKETGWSIYTCIHVYIRIYVPLCVCVRACVHACVWREGRRVCVCVRERVHVCV